ncbi:hypothetical protein [Benzoatithermus flavus]|uniref:Uncharacterized protein n=1 Tax=Benzoatithermus flavus TaxID=3108223 RepID=A0ABU8XPD1_9PROT
MTTQDHRPPGKIPPPLRPEGESEHRDELLQPTEDATVCLPEADPADVSIVRQVFHLSLAQLAAIFGIPFRKAKE